MIGREHLRVFCFPIGARTTRHGSRTFLVSSLEDVCEDGHFEAITHFHHASPVEARKASDLDTAPIAHIQSRQCINPAAAVPVLIENADIPILYISNPMQAKGARGQEGSQDKSVAPCSPT